MSPVQHRALARIVAAHVDPDRPPMPVAGDVNTDDVVAHSTAVALRARGLVELWTQDTLDGSGRLVALSTPAGVELVRTSRARTR